MKIESFDVYAENFPEVQLPAGARVLHFGRRPTCDADELSVWALVDEANPLVYRRFRLAGAGDVVEPAHAERYVGTVPGESPKHVTYHLFDLGERGIVLSQSLDCPRCEERNLKWDGRAQKYLCRTVGCEYSCTESPGSVGQKIVERLEGFADDLEAGKPLKYSTAIEGRLEMWTASLEEWQAEQFRRGYAAAFQDMREVAGGREESPDDVRDRGRRIIDMLAQAAGGDDSVNLWEAAASVRELAEENKRLRAEVGRFRKESGS